MSYSLRGGGGGGGLDLGCSWQNGRSQSTAFIVVPVRTPPSLLPSLGVVVGAVILPSHPFEMQGVQGHEVAAILNLIPFLLGLDWSRLKG